MSTAGGSTSATMEYRQLGSSDLEVSVVGLGCMMFGLMCDQEQTNAVVAAALDEGINFFDTADIYGGPHGRSEVLLGKALGSRRQDIILTTKFGAKSGGRGGSAPGGGTRDYIMAGIENSLRQLGTDYVDLYQYHFPDSATAADETLQALEDLIRHGKVRYIGCSNMSGAQLREAEAAATAAGTSHYVSAQNWYSLITRNIEQDLLPVARAAGISIIPYFPLESGLLTGKYRKGEAAPAGSRLAQWGGSGSADKLEKVEVLRSYAESIDRSLLELAMAGLTNREWVGTVIAGVTTPEQVQQNARAGAISLTEAELAGLDALS